VTAISKDKNEIDPIRFLLDVRMKNIGDENNLFIIQYLTANFEHNLLQKYVLYENLPKDLDKWFDSITLLNKWNLIDIDKVYHHRYPSSIPQLNYIFKKYFQEKQKVIELEKENQEMKTRIEELELQVKYMPGGDGYLEAKEHFESLK
jgi:hypothetical protein